ncbi:MAG TPA: anthranilate phosphoribosyltransferase [Bryobacteraceae bacterium]|jgi:anthranilate phosphoribosyltransferase
MSFLGYLHRVSDGAILSAEDAQEAMEMILAGHVSSAQIAGFAVAIKMRGEVVDEVIGFARAMRKHSVKVDVGIEETLIDTCGTGGDGAGTFNVSTVAAFVVCGAGLKVAKHGNRSASGVFGSADLLEALGVEIDVAPEECARAIREIGIGFLFAPALHPAMKHAREARTELKMRTVFNLLGPLTNPAGAQVQLIGAPSEQAARIMAEALCDLGTRRALVVHGLDGLDEISTTGPTEVYEACEGRVSRHLWTPADFGVPRTVLSKLIPDRREDNVEIAREILSGRSGAHRDIVLVNSAAALWAAGRVTDLRAGVKVAGESIDSGAAAHKLDHLIKFHRRIT